MRLKIVVRTVKGRERVISAYALQSQQQPTIVWHESLAEGWPWTVTHVPTGRSIWQLASEEAAQQFASMVQWVPYPANPDPLVVKKFVVDHLENYLAFTEAATRLCEGNSQTGDASFVAAFLRRCKLLTHGEKETTDGTDERRRAQAG